MSGYGQPDELSFSLQMQGVTCVETPVALTPHNIIDTWAGVGSFSLRTDIGFEGTFRIFWPLIGFQVHHHLEPIEVGVPAVTLPPVVIPAGFALPPGGAAYTVLGGPYTAGAGALVPPGTYRVLTHFRPTNPAFARIIAGFYEGPVIEVLPAP